MYRQLDWVRAKWGHATRSLIYISAVAWLHWLGAHPLVRTWHNVLLHAFALLTGGEHEVEHYAFAKRRLMQNDAYRDRLLAPEIADLVDLWEALQMTIAQRKAYFRCFLHLDFMRRSGVSRAELLRYCNLRYTPMTEHLLPSHGRFASDASMHRGDTFKTERWDVVQLLALSFSLCTMEEAVLVRFCIAEIEQRAEHNIHDEEVLRPSDLKISSDSECKLSRQISMCLEYSYGVPNPVEANLAKLLQSLYEPAERKADFLVIHGVKTLADVINLFPVLLFPCVWLQNVVKRRVLGAATWLTLSQRRKQLNKAGISEVFAAPEEIIESAKVRLLQKGSRLASCWPETREPPKDDQEKSDRGTPRKIFPADTHSHSSTSNTSCEFSSIVDWNRFSNFDDAWQETANSVLATAFLCSLHQDDPTVRDDDWRAVFAYTRVDLQTGSFPVAKMERIRSSLVREYGYRFANFLFEKSSLKGCYRRDSASQSVQKEQRRATQRYQKSCKGMTVVEDKAIYWKEYTDPLVKRPFYHNIRTGESRWEQPANFNAKQKRGSKHRKRDVSSEARNENLTLHEISA